MAVIVVAIGCLLVWFDIRAIRYMQRTSPYRRIAAPVPTAPDLEQLFERTFAELTELFGLRACWFETFPFDTSLPRIEPGRIAVPSDESGNPPVTYTSIELPIRLDGLPLGRIVLLPGAQSVTCIASPSARDAALGMADVLAAPVAAALKGDDTSRFGALRSSARAVGPGHSRHVGP